MAFENFPSKTSTKFMDPSDKSENISWSHITASK